MNPWNEFMDSEDLEISDHFFVELAEKWYRIVHPDMTKKDPADLINQMTLVSIDQAKELNEWFSIS